MNDGLLLGIALVVTIAGVCWLALSLDAHWRQVRGAQRLKPASVKLLRALGAVALLVSLGICLHVDHPSMASLVWVMALAASALIVAFTLSWRPRWLAPLVIWIRAG